MVVSIIAVVATAGCGGSPTAPGAMGSETLELRLTTTHFRLFAGQTSATTVQSAADALERQYARVLTDLKVTSLAFGMTPAAFEAEMYASIRAKYL
jgi:hypothetical protein